MYYYVGDLKTEIVIPKRCTFCSRRRCASPQSGKLADEVRLAVGVTTNPFKINLNKTSKKIN